MECYWIRNTDATLAGLRRASEGVAVIPLASIESHGPHLPLGSDPICFEHIVAEVAKQETVAILPPLHYSYVGEARMLPGAIHLRSELLTEMVENICDEVHRNGFDKVVLLHGHGGNDMLLGAFLKRVLEREKPYAVYSVPVFAGAGGKITALLETKEYGHACEFETSLNMFVCPELVDLDALGAKTFPTQPAPDVGAALTPVDWTARHPEMAVGEPQKGTVEKGRQFAEIWVDAIVATLRRIKKDNVCPEAMDTYRRQVRAVGEQTRSAS